MFSIYYVCIQDYRKFRDSLKRWPAGLWPVELWMSQLELILSGPSGQCMLSGQHFSTGIPLRSFVFIPLETYFLVVMKIERLK